MKGRNGSIAPFAAGLAAAALLAAALSCSGKHDFEKAREKYFTPVHTDLTYIKDDYGRYVQLHGVNVSGSTKVPATTDPVSYVGKPFSLEDADLYFDLLSDLGFNAIRLLVIWEAIEPEARGVYDEDYLDFIEGIVERADAHGIYVLMDMHQDIFSRHLLVKYNDRPRYHDESGAWVEPEPGSLESMLLALVPDETGAYTERVAGDGAPRWVIETCLPEKNLDSPNWGTFRVLGGLTSETLAQMVELIGQFFPAGTGPTTSTPWIAEFASRLPPPFALDESTDMMPWTNWGLNSALSSDVQRCYASLFAGDTLYPGRTVDGTNLKDYLQGAYADAWVQVARRVGPYPNVIGYDIMNEPLGAFITLAAVSLFFSTGMADGAEDFLVQLLGPELGPQIFAMLTAFGLLPPDASPETVKAWGYEGIDLMTALDINLSLDQKYLQPFYERVGQAIQTEDSDAIIWFETSMGIGLVLGDIGPGMMEINMRRPGGIDQVVYGPHWYTDIYPFPGFTMPPRSFTVEEVRFRDYTESLMDLKGKAAYSLGNIPVVFGEFGTYFNFGGIETSVEQDYAVSAAILDNYYESFESMMTSQMLWCFSPENDARYGDLWNKEDFSILDPDLQPRGEEAFSRPYARFLSGKPVSTHFFSDLHYYDPDKGVVDPEREFEVRFESKETDAPTEIFVPRSQYPDGFYVWVSDGSIMFDDGAQILYFFPDRDEPGVEHFLRIRPPLEHGPAEGWNYHVKDGWVIHGQ